jgi:multidrug resistance efflux pump
MRGFGRAITLSGLVVVSAATTGTAVEKEGRPGRLILTGELAAVRSVSAVVPRTPMWVVNLRWLETDGAQVKKGQRIAEFDSSSFTGTLEEKELTLQNEEADLVIFDSEADVTRSDKSLALDQKRTARDKAAVDAAVPVDLRARREWEEKQLALKKADVEVEKAAEDLEGFRRASGADRDVKRISIEKARREIRTAREAIAALVLTAPQDGILVVGENPRERRKIQVGDSLWPGIVVARIPDLSAVQVEAWQYDVDDGRVRVGDPAVATVDAFPAQALRGRVSDISAIAGQPVNESLRRVFRVIVALDARPTEALRPGMSAKVEIGAAGAGAKPAKTPALPSREVLEKAERVTVRSGDLVVEAELKGTMAALDSEGIGPTPLPEVWDYRIAMMAPEGGSVKKGAPVLAFDTSTLTQRLDEKIAEADEAQTKIRKAERSLELRRQEIAMSLAEAEARKKKADLKVDVPENLMAANELAKAKLDQALTEREVETLSRKKELTERSARMEMEIYRRSEDRARTRVREIRDAIVKMTILAPRDGTVIYLTNWRDEKKKVGDSCWRAEKVLEVPDLSRMGVKGEVDEADAGRVADGQKVAFRLDAHPDQEFTGVVQELRRTVGRAAAKNPQKVARLDVKVDRVDPQKMRPGMRVRGSVEIERFPGVLTIPLACLFPSPDGPVVFRSRGSRVETVRIVPGRRAGGKFEVRSGLSEGDVVLKPAGGNGGDRT